MHPDYGYFEEAQLGKPYDLKLLRRLLPFVSAYRSLIFYSILLVLGITALDLALPYVTKIAIDRYIVPRPSLAQSADAQGETRPKRYLKVELDDPQQRAVVEKYSALFQLEGRIALISHADLRKIEKSDLKMLRRSDVAGLGKMA
ncbi:MAG: hypothetical protein PVG59_13795, partial [Desulfobacterales bacterium]